MIFFWFFREKDGEPAEKINKLLLKHNGYLVPIEGFDEMMLQMNNKLGYDLLDGKIIEVAKQRAQRYKEQIEDIQKREAKESDTAMALKETISKGKRNWWSVELEATAEKDNEKIDRIYTNGIKEFPQSHELLANYALFLYDIRKDYDKAEQYYKKALELDPSLAIATGNYAVFLNNIKKDYDEAERYYKKALELDPNYAIHTVNYAVFLAYVKKDNDKAEQYYKKALELDPSYANSTGNYANFLWQIKKDNDKAEQYYKKALELDPNDANTTGNYAQLLIITGRKEEGEKLIKRAFELKPENTDLLTELWFYRYANFYEEYGETTYEELVNLIKAGARSIGWNFKENIELAKKEGHPFIDKLEKLDKIITEDAPPDNL